MGLKLTELSTTEVVYTHIDENTGKVTNIAVERLMMRSNSLRELGFLKPITIQIEPWFVDFCLTSRGVEAHRLARLGTSDLRHPLIFCDWPDGTQLLVDGHHRYVKHHQLGHSHVDVVLIKQDTWSEYVIDVDLSADHAQRITGSFSGII